MRDELDIPLPAMSPGGTTATSYRVPRPREGVDPNTKRLAIIAAGIVGVFVVFVGAYSFMGSKRGGVPVVEADARPLRSKPDNAGGMQVAGKDEAILSGKADGAAALSPPTEAPAPQALKPPAPQALVPPVVAATTPVAPPVAATASVPSSAAPMAVLTTPEKPAASVPTPAPRVAPVAVVPAARVAARTAPAVATPAGKGALIQLAAVGSEQAAQSEWQRLEKRMPELLGGRKPVISKIERDGKTFWRLRTAGFADANAAKSFCDQIKAKAGNCTVAVF